MNVTRKILAVLLIAAFSLQQAPACAYTMIPEFLCELGIQYFQKGDLDEARSQFSKALALEPGNPVALKYLGMIDGRVSAPSRTYSGAPAVTSKQEAVNSALDAFSGKAAEPAVIAPAAYAAPRQQPRTGAAPAAKPPHAPKVIPIPVLTLDRNIRDIRMPVELAKDRKLVIRGRNITRHLITEPAILRAEQTSADELTLTGNDLGYTYLHVWDERDRWTLEFLGVPPKPEGIETLEEELMGAEEKTNNFKLRYSVNWQSFETGPDLNNLRRSSYSWNHWLALTGPTPYGDYDAQVSVSTVRESTDITYLTTGLTNGKYEGFEDFNVRLIDFTPNISNLAFSSSSLRGAYFNSKAFERHVDYTVFWGKEGGGKYWGLSPGLTKPKSSYLDGFELNYMPQTSQFYSVSAFHGWGSDRQQDLRSAGYDFKTRQSLGNWTGKYEIASDSEKLANLLSVGYQESGFNFNTELRDTHKEFKTMTGTGWRAGETGVLTTANFRPMDQLDFGARLDVYKDKLFPNPEQPNTINEDFSFDSSYAIDDTSSLRADYSLQNERGKISPLRSHNIGAGIYKSFGERRKINTYATYRHQESTFFSSHVNDFINEKSLLGVRFAVIGDLYYYVTHEYNWLQARYYGTRSNPWALETGFDFNRQIFETPFYGDFRVVYRNEEDTVSPVSFLAGEDYLEWSAELSYRPTPDFESFFSGRLRNIWPENEVTDHRLDLSLYAGLRYTWDTGFRWEPVGDIEGYVFKDLDQDGIRQTGDSPIEGIKIQVGKNREVVTDKHGYFYAQGVKGKKCGVAVNTSTLPPGFVLTTPQIQEAEITHGKIESVNFGLSSRTEITGSVFVDFNGNGKFDQGDKPVKGAILGLENGKVATSDSSGRYVFGKVAPGRHTVKLDISTLSSDLLPAVPVFQEIELTEGASFVYNIPCKSIPSDTGNQRE